MTRAWTLSRGLRKNGPTLMRPTWNECKNHKPPCLLLRHFTMVGLDAFSWPNKAVSPQWRNGLGLMPACASSFDAATITDSVVIGKLNETNQTKKVMYQSEFYQRKPASDDRRKILSAIIALVESGRSLPGNWFLTAKAFLENRPLPSVELWKQIQDKLEKSAHA